MYTPPPQRRVGAQTGSPHAGWRARPARVTRLVKTPTRRVTRPPQVSPARSARRTPLRKAGRPPEVAVGGWGSGVRSRADPRSGGGVCQGARPPAPPSGQDPSCHPGAGDPRSRVAAPVWARPLPSSHPRRVRPPSSCALVIPTGPHTPTPRHSPPTSRMSKTYYPAHLPMSDRTGRPDRSRVKGTGSRTPGCVTGSAATPMVWRPTDWTQRVGFRSAQQGGPTEWRGCVSGGAAPCTRTEYPATGSGPSGRRLLSSRRDDTRCG